MTEKNRRDTIACWVDLLNGLVPHGRSVELPVLSGSMSPLIKPGSTIRIRSISGKDIRAGDIIVFRDGNTLTTHRLLARIPMGGFALLYQKGDANRFGSWIRGSRVVGVVDAVLNDAGGYTGISYLSLKSAPGSGALQQILITLWNTGLIIPRFIKRCLTKK